MNTTTKAIRRPRCEKCGDVFEIVGNTAIRLAQARPPTRSYDKDTGAMREDKGICPKHPRSLGYEQ
jgi:hypothetical protein